MSLLRLAIVSASIGVISGCAHTQTTAELIPELSPASSSRVHLVGQEGSAIADIYAVDNDVVYLLDGISDEVSDSANDEVVSVEVLIVGRYQLVQTSPSYIQANLLAQPVTVDVVARPLANIGHALFSAVELSGYSLCKSPEVTESLYKMPLPSVHYQMGPMSLINTLQVIVGPGWQVLADQTNRLICFKPFEARGLDWVESSKPSNIPLSIKNSESFEVPSPKKITVVGAVPVEPAKNAVSSYQGGFNDFFSLQDGR